MKNTAVEFSTAVIFSLSVMSGDCPLGKLWVALQRARMSFWNEASFYQHVILEHTQYAIESQKE